MTERRLVDAKRPWAEVMGYSRAVRVGDVIEVAGTAAADEEGNVVGGDSVEEQTRAALRTIGEALRELGSGFEDVVRTRLYLRDPSRWEEAARAHGEVFRDVRPANTTLGGTFVDPAMLVEIEVTAIAGSGGST